jgi:glycopeptide antibiotics resistance protein
LFDEKRGNRIHSARQTGADITIPERFRVVDQEVFESPVTEAGERSYPKNVFINIVGFVPLGFVLALYFHRIGNPIKAVVATTLVGVAASVAIEYVQSYLPTRFSGMTDIVTNTAGTAVGAVISKAYSDWMHNVSRESPQGNAADASLE